MQHAARLRHDHRLQALIPKAKAGIQCLLMYRERHWTPACAGVTAGNKCRAGETRAAREELKPETARLVPALRKNESPLPQAGEA